MIRRLAAALLFVALVMPGFEAHAAHAYAQFGDIK